MLRVFGILASALVLSIGISQAVPVSPIKYIIVIIQENRTPDNLFQGLPGADIARSGMNSKGVYVPLVQRDLADPYDVDHSHAAFVTEYASGAMNGWDDVRTTCPTNACDTQTAFAYVPRNQVMPYFTLASTYTFGDRTFQDNQGPSFPAHQFAIAGTSIPWAGSNLMVSENLYYPPPYGPFNGPNCDGPASLRVMTIDPLGNETTMVRPCFEHPTIMDLLTAHGISWHYYNSVSGGFWSAPDAIQHLRYGPAWNNVIVPETAILTDIKNGTLPQVSWVIPSPKESDHADVTNGSGPAYVANIVNTVGASKYWPNVAIFITWDDWGGWFDHVKPPIINSYELGFRVPLIVVSPYAKRAYVSHVQHQQSSILHFIESTFGLGTLGYQDAHADDLADCFDYSLPLRAYTYIPTPGWSAAALAKSAGPSKEGPDDDF